MADGLGAGAAVGRASAGREATEVEGVGPAEEEEETGAAVAEGAAEAEAAERGSGRTAGSERRRERAVGLLGRGKRRGRKEHENVISCNFYLTRKT